MIQNGCNMVRMKRFWMERTPTYVRFYIRGVGFIQFCRG